MRIAIVNDMGMAVEVLKRIIADAGYDLAWTAVNGEEAVKKCCADIPDLVLMDLIMPAMNGAEATGRIMGKCPCPILIVTSSIEAHSSHVFEAMGAGALDVVDTPELDSSGDMKGALNLISKIATIKKLHGNNMPERRQHKAATKHETTPLLAIGCSTGGPTALASLLAGLPEEFPAAIAIVQHVDGQFSDSLAQWLDSQSRIKVNIASSGTMLQTGQAYLAPGDRHMLIKPGGIIHITRNAGEHLYVPSVDLFFESLCNAGLAEKSVAALLTGMGTDGAKGLLSLKQSGWLTIAQDEESSVVWGMPGAAVKLGAAKEICSIERMAKILTRHFKMNFQERE